MTTPESFAPGYRLTDGNQLNFRIANPQWSTTSSVSATPGGTMTTSAKVVNAVTNITNASAPGAGITLPQALEGTVLLISNNSANDVRIFADGDSTINGLAGVIGIILVKGTTGIFVAVATKQWSQLNTTANAGLLAIDKIATLRATTVNLFAVAYVEGYYTPGDGGGGFFYGVSGGTYTDNGGTIIVPGGGTGTTAWLRTNSEFLTPSMFGVMGTSNIAALAQMPVIAGKNVAVVGYYADGDGGGGIYYAATGGSFTDNGGTIIVPGGGTAANAWLRNSEGPVSVKCFGAKGDGSTNDTNTIQAAFNSADVIYIPESTGAYVVSKLTITVPGKTILTAGLNVTIQQLANFQSEFSMTGSGPTTGNYDAQIIAVLASNVTLGDLSFNGNIATDSGEYNHCIYLQDINDTIGPLHTIQLGSYYATNIRGDVLYIGGLPTTTYTNVTTGSLDGDNIYRSICSITGGEGITISHVLGYRVGYRNIDCEPNPGSQIVTDVYVDYIRGGCIQLAATFPGLVGNVHYGNVHLDSSFMPVPTPHYISTIPPDIAIIASVFNFFQIDSLIINNYTYDGLHAPVIAGASPGRIVINNLQATNIGGGVGSVNTVILASGLSSLSVNSGNVSLLAGTYLVKANATTYCNLLNMEISGGDGLVDGTVLLVQNVNASGAASYLFADTTSGVIQNCNLATAGDAQYQCADMNWFNCTVTCGLLEFSPAAGSNGTVFSRGTLNGTFYDYYSYNVSAPMFSAKQSAGQSVASSASFSTLAFDTVEFDTASGYDIGTNLYRPGVPGYYQVDAGVAWNAGTGTLRIAVNKNGSTWKEALSYMDGGQGITISALVYLNGTTDVVAITAAQVSGVSQTTSAGATTFFQASFIRP